MNMENLRSLYHLLERHWPVIVVASAWFAKDCKGAWNWLADVHGILGIKRYILTGNYEKPIEPPK